MTLPRSGPAGPAPSSPEGSSYDAYDGLDDRGLVARVTEGDGEALEALYRRYGRPCYGLARRILADDQFAQDVVQEVFLTVWRDASRFDASRGGFSSWLLSMTHHKAVDAVRREENLRKRRTTAEGLEERESEAPEVGEQVWSQLRRSRVREALQTLPAAQREALEDPLTGVGNRRALDDADTRTCTTAERALLATRIAPAAICP